MTTGILSLSNELLRSILDHIDADPERTVSIDRRAYLSVESFRPPEPPPPPRAQDIAHFRLTCRRFAELGIPHQFTRISTRFSDRGLERLEKIASKDYLARHIRKFSYMIPNFYVEGRSQIRYLEEASVEYIQVDLGSLEKKRDDQLRIVKSGADKRILNRAIRAFVSLQHIQILRLQDAQDSAVIDYLIENPMALQFCTLSWSHACTHATKTIADALVEADSPVARVSGPMMNPQSLHDLVQSPTASLLPLAERLTCLELHFDEPFGLTNKIDSLSSAFNSCFRAAKNIQALHLGFPSQAPLDLPLENVFNNIRWDKLRAFGVQAWRLNADEILNFARRHRKTLRGLRLRDVMLRKGSLWKDVLSALREDMEQLDWVSLRRIDYAENFDLLWSGSIEVPTAWPPGLASDSEESDEGDGFPGHVNLADDDDDGVTSYHGDEDNDADDDDDEDDEDDGDDHSDANSDEGPDANELALAPDPSVELPTCTCERSGYPASANDLGDNGKYVIYQQRKLWEKWVVGRCPEHGKPEDR